ncbi:MAG: glycosyltransferase family A protein [Terracidiphilus sp.]|jgi:glycosyltransferase involved in cell wall biosynthesis
MSPGSAQNVAIVVIGRNEGERLKSCLRSANCGARTVVYVDSGSVDGSADYARSVGCRVVELDAARPFTAARARNAGFACVVKHEPDAPFVQFVDGDCELVEGWLERGVAALTERPEVDIVCGHVREIHPEASVYNRLCDLEWRQTPGEIRTSGGRFMIRREVFSVAGGFRADVIAAEDDEFCVRVRGLGSKILMVDAEMARHDAAMMRFSEWWRRSRRMGHAYAQVAGLHGKGEERYFVRDCRRIWFWGLALPLLAVGLAAFTHWWSLAVLLGAYALQFARIYLRGRKRGWRAGDASAYAFSTVLAKFPALLGMLEYHWRRGRGLEPAIIEYKRSS